MPMSLPPQLPEGGRVRGELEKPQIALAIFLFCEVTNKLRKTIK
jgi:hypothetical protein